MKQVERPPPVLVSPRQHHFNGFINAVVGSHSSFSQIIQSTQNVIVPERRVREAQPAFVDDLSSSKRAKHSPLQQIVLCLLARLRNRSRSAPCSFKFQQSF